MSSEGGSSFFRADVAILAVALILSCTAIAMRSPVVTPSPFTSRKIQCAPWVVNRTIVIVHGQFRKATWKNYQRGVGYNGGEAYWCASLDYTLKKLGFQKPGRVLR